MTMIAQATVAGFAGTFGRPAALATFAPGRVNLIGEHTDYNDGWVLPMAIALGTCVAARATGGDELRVAALDLGESAQISLGGEIEHGPAGHWSNYVRGVAAALRGQQIDIGGAEIVIAGNLPQGAGLSSSASLAVAVWLALAGLAGRPDLDPVLLAKAGQSAEHHYAGCLCGIMDQLICACGEAGSALSIDCRSLEYAAVPMPSDAVVLIVHSGVRRGLVEGEYNRRRAQCERAARYFGAAALRDVTLDELELARGGLAPEEVRRARHVITENARTMAAVSALKSADYAQIGTLMDQSHTSMRDDFAITTPEIDELAGLLRDITGLGARMTGGGFGGAVISVVPEPMAAHVAEQVRRHYRTPDGAEPLVLAERAMAGARLVHQ